jgi:twitching motility protein PilT
MARVDSLLSILDRQGADELRLGVDREPELYRLGSRKHLAMSATSEQVLRDLLGDLLSPEREAVLANDHQLEIVHDAATIGSFKVNFTARQGLAGAHAFDVVFTRTAGTHAVHAPAAAAASPPDPPTCAVPETDVADVASPQGTTGIHRELHAILTVAVARHASDVHLIDGAPPVLRVDGRLAPVTRPAFANVESLFAPWLSGDAARLVAGGRSLDTAFDVADLGRFRLNIYRSSEGIAAAIRILHAGVPALSELRMPMALDDLVTLPHGLVVVCGPTGCGKSTTLAALAKESLRRRGSLVITLEDPIEYQIAADAGHGLARQRQVGRDVASFAVGLRDALRENPDVILIGEMRDQETIELALTAAETGHLVLTSLHSRSSASAVERIVDSCPGERQAQVRVQLADSLRAVISQRLIARAKGSGRAVALEVMRVTHNVASMIRDGKVQQIPNAIQSAKKDGMLSLERSLADLVRTGEIDLDHARAVANDPETLDSYLKG